MESLKEFKYFNPNTKAPIPDPDVKLSFDKNGRPTWRNRRGQTAGNPNWWVAAETKGEQNSLSNFSDSKQLSLNQVLTNTQASNLEKAAREKAAAEVAAAEKNSAEVTAKKKEEDKKQKDDESKKRAARDIETVVKNLSDSGILQTEVTKAVVNSNDIPIFTEDFGRIRKAINTVLSKATKSKLFTHKYTADEGVAVENGEANAKPAQEIAKGLIERYLTSSKSQDGKTVFSYSILPVAAEVSESLAVEGTRLFEDAPASDQVTTPAEQPSQGTTDPAPKNKETPPVEQPSNSSTITLSESSKENLTNELAEAIEPLLSEISKTITSSAKMIKYHCSAPATPDQEDNSSQTVEQKAESKDRCVFQRLLEDGEVSGDPETQEADGASSEEEAVSSETASQKGSTEESKKETPAKAAKEEPDKAASKEAVAFPSNDTLKTIVDGLNKVGKSFETSNATYNLSYSMDNIDPKDKSFDIIVTSTSTTPKDSFWTWFGGYLKKAGVQIAHNLVGERGVMSV